MIKILTTGGTIGGYEYAHEADIPKITEISIEDFLKVANVSVEYSIQTILKKDSRFITEKDRQLIIETIYNEEENKILITHGTYTMVETAIYIGRQGINKTIVLVGSFILGTLNETDAPSNLKFAIDSLMRLPVGVYIAMNEQVFDWNNVKKNSETNKFERNDQ